MRDEMLKRLDTLVAGLIDNPMAWQHDWRLFRAELAAERCENCRHWEPLEVSESMVEYEAWVNDADNLSDQPVHPRSARPMWKSRENARCCTKLTDRNEKALPRPGLVSTYDGTSTGGGHVAEETWTEPDFCCAHFTRKESTP